MTSRTLVDGDVLNAVIASLWGSANSKPGSVSEEATFLHLTLSRRESTEFFFDERDYFLGETALLAAATARLLGDRVNCERWLDRADASYRHTVAPAPHLGRVAYTRLALRFDSHRFDDVRELIPSVALTFRKLGMSMDLAKCLFLEAINLKEMGETKEAAHKLVRLIEEEDAVSQLLRGMALINLGDIHSNDERFEDAMSAYRRALPILEATGQEHALADLKLSLASALRQMGLVDASLVAYAEAAEANAKLGLVTRAAYARVLFAEALLAAGKAREAEWQLLAALPTIDEQKMVPEGFAAVGLLRESIRQRNTDPKALTELRQYLQVKS
jgi:tetratricopeptide (TPR) repeat protein